MTDVRTDDTKKRRGHALPLAFALLAGTIVGALTHEYVLDPSIADGFALLAEIFLRLIKMIVAPLVLASLAAGIARMGGGHAVGRIGMIAMIWFMLASLISLLIGAAMALWLEPGAGLALKTVVGRMPDTSPLSVSLFFQHLFPTSIIDAMAKNEVLQIVVFAVFAGLGMGAMGTRALPIVEMLERIAELMFKITEYVISFAPIGVFGAVAAAMARQGPAILTTYGKLIASFYMALAVLWTALICAGWLVIGPRIGSLLKSVRSAALVSFSTASSEAAYPQLLTSLDRFGIPPRLASFILPLGYSFNLDGTMMYCTFAVIFLAQGYGVPMGAPEVLLLTGILFVTGKGIASVPRGSLIVIAAALPYFGIPPEGVLLILAVDQILDMGRSGTNIVGNSIAVAAIAQFERSFEARRTRRTSQEECR